MTVVMTVVMTGATGAMTAKTTGVTGAMTVATAGPAQACSASPGLTGHFREEIADSAVSSH